VRKDARVDEREQERNADEVREKEREKGGCFTVTAEYFNEFMCLSNYGDKCLCINWQLAASLTLTLFLSLSHSHLPSLKIYVLTAL